jgi:uncharacterized protein (TIGR00299 family) protein
MRILLFDPFHGAAGDMIIGALLGCGADEAAVLQAMKAVVANPSVSAVARAGIRAVHVETHASLSHRTFDEVMARLDAAAPAVPPGVPAMARRVFERIRAAEERVHGEQVHFHEVGADDAIADVIGACTALSTLRVDGVAMLPVAVGSGMVTGSHGTFPVPAPATANILAQSGLEVRPSQAGGELCTPTGAALLAEFSSVRPADLGAYTISSVGYGAGTRDTPGTPNVLRAMVVETAGSLQQDVVDILETNVDDVSGEIIACAISRFMDEGARDASAMPIIMKKGRPGFLIRVISSPELSSSLAALMARELGTLGIRCTPAVHRFIADRTIGQVLVEIGGEERIMPVKYGLCNGVVYIVKAEFGPAQEWADKLGMPVREVIRRIEDAGRKTLPTPLCGTGVR